MPASVANPESPWPHRLAMAVACATFPLIFVGGLVTSYDAGMAVPDWPTTYGYNLFLYPWQTWFFGPWDLFIEHGHRLLGALVGLLTIGLVAVAWRFRQPAPVRWLSIVALAAVIVQGVLGGMRVQLNEVLLARIHGCFGPAFFALAAVIAVITSRGWRSGGAARSPAAPRLRRLSVVTAALAYLQLVLGAHLRHVTPNMSTAAFRAVLLFHLVVAAALAVHVALLAWWASAAARAVSAPRPTAALLLPVLVALQILLGGATWVVKYGWPAWFADTRAGAIYTVTEKSMLQAGTVTAHVALGSLIVASSVLAALWSFRRLRPEAAAGASVLAGLLAVCALRPAAEGVA